MKIESNKSTSPLPYCESLSASGGVTGENIEVQTIDSLFEKLFCSETEAFSIDGIDYSPIKLELFNDIKRVFNDFESLALKQLELLQKHLGNTKIFIGQIHKTEFQDGTRIGVDGRGLFQDHDTKYIGINLTQEAIEQQMDKYLFVMEPKDTNNVEVKAIKLGDLFHGNIAKLGAFLLFHELFHVNSFAEEGFDPEAYKKHCQDFDGNFSSASILNDIKLLFKTDMTEGQNLCDDALNTINIDNNTHDRCPGEFELLKDLYLLYSLRLYQGINLDFTNKNVKEACLRVYKSVFNITADELIIDKSVNEARKENNKKISTKISNFWTSDLSKEEIETIKLQEINLQKKEND